MFNIEPYWNSVTKAIVKNLDDLNDFDLFMLIIDENNNLIDVNEINKRESRELIMVDCAEKILNKYTERYNEYMNEH